MRQRGFTLLEVLIALAILGVSLVALLTTNSASMANAGRARDVTIAALLARSKMIDIEQKLFDEGFTEGEQEDKGDFSDEKHPEVTWEYKVSEIELDLTGLGSLCGGFGEAGGDGVECEGMVGGMGGMFEGFTQDLGRSVRLVELVVTWPVGAKYHESMSVRAVVSRDDFNLNMTNPLTDQQQQQQQQQQEPPRK
jgi:general secretion pathway protein I